MLFSDELLSIGPRGQYCSTWPRALTRSPRELRTRRYRASNLELLRRELSAGALANFARSLEGTREVELEHFQEHADDREFPLGGDLVIVHQEAPVTSELAWMLGCSVPREGEPTRANRERVRGAERA
jgi:hypothetical protein